MHESRKGMKSFRLSMCHDGSVYFPPSRRVFTWNGEPGRQRAMNGRIRESELDGYMLIR